MARILTRYSKAALFALIAAAILILSLLPRLPEPVIRLSWIDKLEHFASYAVFAASLYSILPEWKRRSKFFTVLLASLFYGGVIEYLQQFTGRTPDIYDLAADLAGAAAGSALYGFLIKRG